jgi:hypothetical protein
MNNINSLIRDVRKRTTSNGAGWKSGIYQVINKEKYMGLNMPVYKSSFEQRMMHYLDNNSKVKKWGYETVKIPYTFSLDKRTHNYYTDFYTEIEDNTGNIQKYILEIKPSSSLVPPVKPKNPTGKAMKNYLYNLTEYMKNKSKWQAAQYFCESHNMKFQVITEKQIF